VVSSARDRLSQEMDFEEAARQHKRIEKIEGVMRLKDELVSDIDRLHGVAVTTSINPGAVELWFVHQGSWQPPYRFHVAETTSVAGSLDQRLKEALSCLQWNCQTGRRRQEHLALLARWYYSSWREGEWLPFDSLGQPPMRKLVRSISRVAQNTGP